jgi:cephalosporin hydroxylase
MISAEVAQIVKARAAFGQLELGELTELAEQLLAFPWEPDYIIVEIGTYKGKTPIMMAKALATIDKYPLIVSIDAFERVTPTPLNCRGNYATTIAGILEAKLGSQCIVISASSSDVEDIIPYRIGALIIDGWHSYEQASADLRNYMPKVVPGGFCLVDDYCDFYPGVIQAVDEYLAAHGSTVKLEKHESKWVILRKL